MSDHHDCIVCPCPRPRSTHCPCLHRARVERAVEAGDGGTVIEAPAVVERQTWERRIPDTDRTELAIHLEVDAEGRVRLHEAVLARVLVEAGWERTA